MLSLLAAFFLAAPAQDTAHVVVVATTDVHGRATDWDYVTGQAFPGGLTRVASVVDSLKTQYPGQVVVVDGGDVIQGNAFASYFGRVAPRDPNPIIEAMNLIGYDVATPGNHEFDFGLSVMRNALSGAAFPYVSGNLYTLRGDTLAYPPYVVVRRKGIRVGVAGFTTPGAMVWNKDQLQGKLRIEQIPRVAGRVVEALRRVSDLAIVVIHSGMGHPASYDTAGVGAENAAASLARLPAPPDLVVVGHSHREIRDSVIRGVHFVQPKPFAGSVSVTHIDMAREKGRWRMVRVRGDLVPTAGVSPSPRLTQRLASAHAAVLQWVATPIGEASAPMRAHAARAQPTPLLDFVNAVQRKRSGADLSAASAFDLRGGFDSGPIRIGQVVGVYPFDNTLRAVRISGAGLKQYLENAARYFETDAVGRISLSDTIPGYNFDVIAGARYDIDLRRPIGDRIQNLSVRGRAVSPGDQFTLALNSHRQTGTGGYTMLRGLPVVYDKGENIRDLLIEEITTRKILDPAEYPAGEWRIVPEVFAAAVRDLFRVQRASAESPRDTVILRILATTDLHGALAPKPDSRGSPAPGVALLASSLDSLEAQCGCPTLRLDAGDAMQGTLTANVTRGRAVVDVLNRLRLGAAVPGDHDFEWSVDTLRRRMSEARFPWVAANVFDVTTGRRPEWSVPYRMMDVGELRIAIVGYITPDIKSSIKPELTSTLRFGDGALAIHDVLAEVKAHRPDLTIVLAHAGGSCTGASCTGEVVRMADAIESRAVDLIVGGHTHQTVNTRVADVAIVQAGNEGRAIAVADVVKTPAGGREVRTRIEPVPFERAEPNGELAALVESHRRRVDSLTNRVVATVKAPMPRDGDQYRLGTMIAEARRNVLRTDVGLVSNSGVNADLPAGKVTYGQLLEIQPSQSRLVKVTLSGAQLRDVAEQALQSGRPSAHIAGVRVRYDPRRRPGSRVESIELQGKKLRSNTRYTLAADDFLAAGGDGYAVLVGLPSEPGALLDVDGVTTYLQRLPQPAEFKIHPGFVSTRQ